MVPVMPASSIRGTVMVMAIRGCYPFFGSDAPHPVVQWIWSKNFRLFLLHMIRWRNMRPFILSFSLCFLVACNSREDFFYGKWDLGYRNGHSVLTIREDKTADLVIQGAEYIKDTPFKIAEQSSNSVTIEIDEGNSCLRLTLHKANRNQCLGHNFKCYIDENMIDEVFLARRDGTPRREVAVPNKETITLPDNYRGEFFIIYQAEAHEHAKALAINENGYAYSKGIPQLEQLFNANREFRYSGKANEIKILNPNYYGINGFKYLIENANSKMSADEIVIFQKGFNQATRNRWNSEHATTVNNNINIEYFEIGDLAEVRNKYGL